MSGERESALFLFPFFETAENELGLLMPGSWLRAPLCNMSALYQKKKKKRWPFESILWNCFSLKRD